MTTGELRDLIELLHKTESDHHHVEAKLAARELPKRLWETLSAFSNVPDGGIIVLGLDESSGFDPVGVEDPKKIQQDLGSLCSALNPPVRAVIAPHVIDGKTLIAAEVPEIGIDQKPCYYPPAD